MTTLIFHDLTVILPSPEFQDQLSTTYTKYITASRGKELIIGKKSGYDNLSKIYRLKYNFKGISEPIKQQFLDFLSVSVGQVIGLIDYNNIVWAVIITNQVEITNDSRNNNSFMLEAEVITVGIPSGPWLIPQGYLSDLPITEGYE